MPEVLKVARNSDPKKVAGAIAAVIEKDKEEVEIHAVGAAAVNQAVKAVAIARGYVAPKGFNLIAIPAFTKVEINGEEKTAIKMIVRPEK